MMLTKLASACENDTGKAKPKAKRKGSASRPKTAKAKAKACEYKSHQSLFEKDKKALAALILDGKGEAKKCDIEPEEVAKVYNKRFGGESIPVNLDAYPRAATSPANNATLLVPFEPEEIAKKETAAGPDNISMSKLAKLDAKGRLLANLFNTFLVTGKVPAKVKENRPILLPKGDKGLEDVNQWRPLTIASVVLRLYTTEVVRSTRPAGSVVDKGPVRRARPSFPLSPSLSFSVPRSAVRRQTPHTRKPARVTNLHAVGVAPLPF